MSSTLSGSSWLWGRQLGIYITTLSVWLRAAPKGVNPSAPLLCPVPCANGLLKPGGEPLGIAAAGSPLACTEEVGSKVPSKGQGLGTDEFCSVTELAVNASALQARFSLCLVPWFQLISQLTFLCPMPLKPLHLPLSTNEYLLHTRS